jgi:L-histidine Nalpha-methyltransferase
MTSATVRDDPAQNQVSTRGFVADVLAGLAADPKTLPPKYFYDAAGSELFGAICALEEYYPARTETSILKTHADDMAAVIGADSMVIEYGAGSMEKVRILLDALVAPVVFVPVDISKGHLIAAAKDLRRAYPDLAVQQVVADFTKPVPLPVPPRPASRRVAFFPGSTIGNFDPDPTVAFLRAIGDTVGPNGGLLIGIDLQKDENRLVRAYDDAAGVTADFNLNLLTRINRELDGNFVLERFRHVARYDRDLGRIEMHLESLVDQSVRVAGRTFNFAAGETIHTENSYKYTLAGFDDLATRAGFQRDRHWTDAEGLFAELFYIRTP